MERIEYAGKVLLCEATIEGNGPLAGTICHLSETQGDLCVTDTKSIKKLTGRIKIKPVNSLS